MSRIDAQVATQVADVSRPAQSAREQQLQFAAARQRDATQDPDQSAINVANPPSVESVRAAAAQVKQVIETASGRQLSFTVDDTSKTLVVQVSDEKGVVIRQIPSKELLDLSERIKSLVGALFDKKA